MKLTLQVNGREMTFSEQELIAIVEKYIIINNDNQITQTPAEGLWFEVNPKAINQKLFQEERKDSNQEETRQLILEAFAELKDHPKKYGRVFETMILRKEGGSEKVGDLKKMACKFGDHNINWVEQALEWAQRISNGEPWENICNKRDTANWYRLVVWKDAHSKFIGGSTRCESNKPATNVNKYDLEDNNVIDHTVPVSVRYK